MWGAVLDAAIVSYDEGGFAALDVETLDKLQSLVTHRGMLSDFEIPLLVTPEFIARLMEAFPWSTSQLHPETRDCFRFLTEDLARARYLDPIVPAPPAGNWEFCHGVAPDLEEAWRSLLGAAAENCELSSGRCLVGSWGDACAEGETSLVVGDVIRTYSCASSRDEWYPWLSDIDWWPDVQRWVRIVFGADDSLRHHEMARDEPMAFVLEDGFIEAVETHQAHVQHRDALIRALTKRVYGILDHGLGDEQFQHHRRMRVTAYWRIHYRVDSGTIVFEEYGPHSMGGAT
jgi:hypothetical protein